MLSYIFDPWYAWFRSSCMIGMVSSLPPRNIFGHVCFGTVFSTLGGELQSFRPRLLLSNLLCCHLDNWPLPSHKSSRVLCAQYTHVLSMFVIFRWCSMFPESPLNDPWMFPPLKVSHLKLRRSEKKVLNVPWMYLECCLNVPSSKSLAHKAAAVAEKKVLNVPWIFPKCCLNVAWMFPECSLL
jgi:hypothetical protein